MCEIYKIINGTTPEYLGQLVTVKKKYHMSLGQ